MLWRLRLRDSHQSAKVARWANRFFATRKAWKVWVTAIEERKRQDKLKQWDIAKLRKIIDGALWLISLSNPCTDPISQ